MYLGYVVHALPPHVIFKFVATPRVVIYGAVSSTHVTLGTDTQDTPVVAGPDSILILPKRGTDQRCSFFRPHERQTPCKATKT